MGLLDRKHMGLNSKMYALASCCCIFDIQTFLLLPWKESEFTKQCSGTAPNMLMFRTIQLTTILTSLVNIGSQIPYLSTTPFNVYTSFFYANIALASFRALISMLSYCVLAGVLQECEVAKAVDSDSSTSSNIEMSEMTSNVLHNGVGGSNQQVVHGDVNEMIKKLQLRVQLQEEEANNQRMQLQQRAQQQEQLEMQLQQQQYHQQQLELKLRNHQQQQQQELELQMQLLRQQQQQQLEFIQKSVGLPSLPGQLSYPRDDIPVGVEPDASQVRKGKGAIHKIRKSLGMESHGSAASSTSTKRIDGDFDL